MRGLDLLLDLLLPESCPACDAVVGPEPSFCPECLLEVDEVPAEGCGQCGEPGRFRDRCCDRCRARRPPHASAYAAFVHGGAVARAVQRFKYEDHPELSRPLAALLSRRLALDRTDCIVAVPLHRERFIARMYDQAALLAFELGALVHRPVELDWLSRSRDTPRQVGRSELERERNVHGAFAARGVRAGARILLVDDVMTTGATVREASRMLREAGAHEVRVACFARAVREEG